MMTDPIADMLTRIRNAQMAGNRTVQIPASKLKKRLAAILLEEGYIARIEEVAGIPAMLVLDLLYRDGKPMIQHIQRESAPGHRVYKKSTELARVLNDYGFAIISTSQGLMTNKQARDKGVGGEVLCSIY